MVKPRKCCKETGTSCGGFPRWPPPEVHVFWYIRGIFAILKSRFYVLICSYLCYSRRAAESRTISIEVGVFAVELVISSIMKFSRVVRSKRTKSIDCSEWR